MELLWMQNSFSQQLPRALVLSWTVGPAPLARTWHVRERPGTQWWHRSPPHLRPLAPYAGFWIPTWGSSMVPSVPPGTGLFPEPFRFSRACLRCFKGKHQLQPLGGALPVVAGDRDFPKAKHRASQPSTQMAGFRPHHADTHRRAHQGLNPS